MNSLAVRGEQYLIASNQRVIVELIKYQLLSENQSGKIYKRHMPPPFGEVDFIQILARAWPLRLHRE